MSVFIVPLNFVCIFSFPSIPCPHCPDLCNCAPIV
jgi:hypothetical protein